MGIPKDIDAYLARRFYNPSLPGSFTSTTKLHAVIKREGRYNISLNRIDDWAKSQDIITLHRQAREKPVKYRRVIAPGINHMWDCDLLVLTGERFKSVNEGHAYILVTIDVFSRYCRAQPVKSKSGKHMKHGFGEIFDAAGDAGMPKFIRTDRGTEFTNSQVSDLLKDRAKPTIYIIVLQHFR